MHQSEVLSRAINTHNFKKDVTEIGTPRADREKPSNILGKAQDSMYSSKTGFRRLFGGPSIDDIAPRPPVTSVPDDPVEAFELHEPRPAPSPPPSDEPPIQTRASKNRRSSMTTYTINLGATGGQVEREVRRLAGLTPAAFTRPGPNQQEPTPSSAHCFDTVEEVNFTCRSSAGGEETPGPTITSPRGSHMTASRSKTCDWTTGYGGGDSDDDRPPNPPSTRGVPVRSAFGTDTGGCGGGSTTTGVTPSRVSFTGDLNNGNAGRKVSMELLDVPSQSYHGPSPVMAGGGWDPRTPVPRSAKRPSQSQVPVSVPQLGLMKDRKGGSRHNTSDGYTPAGTLSAGGGGGAVSSSSPTSVLRLPTLPVPSTPSRQPSSALLAESRPGSSRLLRGATAGGLGGERRGSLHDPSAAVLRASGTGDGSLSHAPSSGGGGGGRWFQQDAEDLEMMLEGNDDMLQRIMAAGGAGGTGGSSGLGGFSGSSGGLGGPGSSTNSRTNDPDAVTLPRLPGREGEAAPDRALASLQELRKVQANLDEQLARERQAIANGRVRRTSVLEDVAGQHQPRWQVTYNVDPQVNHSKLSGVDASRRSELERAHLTKLATQQKSTAPAPPPVPVAAVSPVVARARRLSTVMV